MSHSDIIIITITLTFASTVGVYAAIRVIKQYTRPPVNALVRSGDIEMVDYIQPSQQIHNYPDLIGPQFPTNVFSGRIPSIWSANPPSYHTIDRGYINSCFENSINLDYIMIILIIMFLVIIFWKINSPYSMLIMIPFSSFDIDFRDSFEWKFNSYKVKPKISYLSIQTLCKDIANLLDSLVDETDFSMSLSFISSYKEWKDNKEKIHPLYINDAIIVNRESDPILISTFIMESLNNKGLFITNWLLEDDKINKMDPVILTVTVAINIKI